MEPDKITQQIIAMYEEASDLHESVNQFYGEPNPETGKRFVYGVHLGDVLGDAIAFMDDIPEFEPYKLIIAFGACFHDAIEDARETYNDILKRARKYLNKEDAVMATEIVYALTNEKGRNRAERANEKYYEGIRTTPFAPFIKMCDRYANMSYACRHETSMAKKYRQELPEFISHIVTDTDDFRFNVPQTLIDKIKTL
jgi:hypothetical protein